MVALGRGDLGVVPVIGWSAIQSASLRGTSGPLLLVLAHVSPILKTIRQASPGRKGQTLHPSPAGPTPRGVVGLAMSGRD